ncbi:hypothetical protein [Trichothermofontia sp.]
MQRLTLGTTIGMMSLASAAVPYAQSPVAQAAEPVWHNCLTREVWSPEKQAWCQQAEGLKQLAYPLPQFGTATLSNGTYQNPDSELTVTLLNRPYTIGFGDLTEGTQAAAVILVANSGGTGNFVHLAVALEQGASFTPVAATLLGDRVNIESVQILNGHIQVDLISHGPNDGACCPTQPLRQVYRLEGDTLTLVSESDRTTAQAIPALY